VWRGIEEIPAELGRTAVTVGNFDGVHRGHQRVLARTRQAARTTGTDTVVAVTFDPHPFAVLRPEHAPPTLTPINERAELLFRAGADAVLVVRFDAEVARWSPEAFVDTVLVAGLHALVVVVGSNFRFGHRAAGDLGTLAAAGTTRDFQVIGVELEGGPQVWSSTYIRHCLATGDVEGAAEALGRPVAVTGPVVEGDRRGRELGRGRRRGPGDRKVGGRET
jgi:riboflavin kinase / FMN adenylyltransferase